jgi:hypothetical protein
MWAYPQMEAIRRNLAVELHTKELALLVTEGLSVILVQSSGAVLPRIYPQS